MKIISINKIFAILFIATILILACTKESADVRLEPNLATTQVTEIKSDSATVMGFVIASGGGFSEKGVCFDIAENPTTSSSKVVYEGEDTKANFPVILSGLNYATKYYARAYGIGAIGTVYGEEITFTTLSIVPTVVTGLFTPTTGVSATGSSEVTNDGGATVTQRGVCYGTSSKPKIDGLHTNDGEGLGQFTSSLANLSGETKYYVRAYAINSAGVAYGADTTFTTPISILTWYLPGDYVEASYPPPYANWSPGVNSPYIMSTLAAGNLLEGYVYMANPNNNWKFATKPNWDGPNYANNDASGNITPGVLHADAKDNIASTAGYYKINVNATTLTYTQLLTTWGIIGNATPGGWGSDTPMSYFPGSHVWGVGATLSQQSPPNDGLKFRANGGWDLNYGDNGPNGVLEQGGTNIGISVAGDYAITLDLSHPNNYTYSLNRWGLIGDFNGWAASVPMSWDNLNMVFTANITVASAGAFKFRANDGWDVNLGGSLSALTPGGDNIAIAAGNYIVTLNPWTKVGTVTSNKKK